MRPCGSFFMRFYRSICFHTGFSVSLLVLIRPHESLWILLRRYVSSWVLMGPYKSLIVLMDSN